MTYKTTMFYFWVMWQCETHPGLDASMYGYTILRALHPEIKTSRR